LPGLPHIVQSRDPSFHSWRRPKIRISRNISLLRIIVDMLSISIRVGRGINSTISMSKTMKITAKRKKRKENGIRAL